MYMYILSAAESVSCSSFIGMNNEQKYCLKITRENTKSK